MRRKLPLGFRLRLGGERFRGRCGERGLRCDEGWCGIKLWWWLDTKNETPNMRRD